MGSSLYIIAMYKPKLCKHCRSIFSPNSSRHWFCSDFCNVFHHVHRKTEGACWICELKTTAKGYTYVRDKRAHRIVWEHCYGEIPAGMLVCHSCDVPACVNIAHLFLGTSLDNMKDMIEKSRDKHPRGSTTHNAKLTESDVSDILMDDRTAYAISKNYNVDPRTIRGIKLGETWLHVPKP